MTQLSDNQVDTLAAFAGMLESYKVASTTPNAQLGHGPGGTFAYPGQNQDVINAMVTPHFGLINRLKVIPTTTTNPLQKIFTGVTAVSGSHPTGQCDPCKVPGNAKVGDITSTFGRMCLSTKTFDLSGDIGAITNRGEFRDFKLVGDPFAAGGKIGPKIGPVSAQAALNSELGKQMIEFFVGWVQEYGRWLWNANPSNSSGSYVEPRGLNILINTGYQDAVTGALLTAANSLIWNINASMTGNGATYVNVLTGAYRRLDAIAKDTGLAPADLVFVMTTQAFYELSAVWPCAYNTSRCVANANGAIVNLDASTQLAMVNGMRAGNYLLIDGKQVEVVLDDSITESESSGEFTSTIYIVPLTIMGNRPATYIEYFNFDNGDSAEIRSVLGNSDDFRTIDGGRFLMVKRKNGFCVSGDVVERSRIRLDAPHLAARITNVKYTPYIQLRSGWQSDTNRFYNGGHTGTTAPSFYAPTVYSN